MIRNKVGIIVACRYDSRRLPGKVLKKIRGKEVLTYIIERLRRVSGATVVVATSKEKSEDPIARFCQKKGIGFFRGAKNNVAKRFLDCAKYFKFDYFVRISGDNVLIDAKLVEKLVSAAIKGKYNLVSNLKNRTFPSGISIEVLKTDFYEKTMPLMKAKYDQEHATTYLYAHEGKIGRHKYVFNTICPQAKDLKLSLDDQNDFKFISKIIGRMKKDHRQYGLKEIYKLTKDLNADNRGSHADSRR